MSVLDRPGTVNRGTGRGIPLREPGLEPTEITHGDTPVTQPLHPDVLQLPLQGGDARLCNSKRGRSHFVQDSSLGSERPQIPVLLRDIEPVKPILTDEDIACGEQDGLPGDMALHLGARRRRLNDDDPGPVAHPIPAIEHGVLETFRAYPEKMDLVRDWHVTIPERRKRLNRNRRGTAVMGSICQPKFDAYWTASLQLLLIDRPQLDMEAAPSLLGERRGRNGEVRRLNANVNEEARFHVAKRAPQDGIVHVLRKGDGRHCD